MTITAPSPRTTERIATPMTVLMCRPTHFTVTYRINPWMDPEAPTDTDRAVAQWRNCCARPTVDWVSRCARSRRSRDCPTWCSPPTAGLVIDGVAYTASFHFPQRQPEGPAYGAWFESAGLTVELGTVRQRRRRRLLAHRQRDPGRPRLPHGHREPRRGRRASSAARSSPSNWSGPSSTTSTPRSRSLDRRPGHEHVAYLPGAFSAASLSELRRRFPDAIEVSEEDAARLWPQRRLRRPARHHRRGRHRLPRPIERPRLHPDRRGPHRTVARRRRRQVLHARVA